MANEIPIISRYSARRGRRDRIEVVMQILEHLSTGCSRPTRISLGLGISYNRLTQVLRSLEELGLVRKDDCGYYVTRNGLMLLDAYRRFRTSLEVYGIKP